ncbi:MAG: hypothetical protein LH467_07600 [Gemmatimonadaceae bacterium]|nr:hypothetical protein [Gemmatimonadaceae bacterium]
MTMPAEANHTHDWWAQPKVVLPIVGAVAILLALLTPQGSAGRLGDSRLSAHLAGLLGARALAETAARLGFDVARRDSVGAPATSAARGHTIHAVLAPTVRLTGAEAHAYLEAVREGDGLLLVFDGRNALSDSLGLWRTPGGILYRAPGDSVACRRRDLRPTLWPDGKVHLYGLRWLRGAPAGHVVLAALQSDSAVASYAGAAAAGFPLGRGRVVVIPDPDLLRNDVLRRCEWGADVLAVGMLEWLRAGGSSPRRSLVFDEYHQGFGPQPSVLGTATRFLVDHSGGRGMLTMVIAGLVWLAAAAPRPIPPRETRLLERRDPLEQVDALAHAYQQVGATRTIVARLLHGVRTRVQRGSATARLKPDDAFLADALARRPDMQADVALIRGALREPVTARELPDVGGALHRLELSLTTTDA